MKNLGIFLTQYTIAGIGTDAPAFMYSLLIYACISIPTDLLLLNHATTQAEENAKAISNE